MLKFILIACLILNVLGQNSYSSLFGMDELEKSPLDDPLANVKAFEQRFEERVKERDIFYKNALRSSDNSHGYSPYQGSPEVQRPQSVNNYNPMMLPPRPNIYSPMEHRPRDSYDANPMNFIGGIYNRVPSDDQNLRILPSDSTTENWLEKRAMYDEFDEVEDRITRADKWDEFKEFATKLKEAAENNPKRDPQNDLRKILEWTRNLDKPKPPQFPKKFMNPQNVDVAKSMPSPGMAGYWGEDETDAVSSELKKLSPKEVKEKALRLLQEVDKMEKQNPPVQPAPEPITISPTPPPERTAQNLFYSFLPKEDDFKAPIRWVSLTSNDTRDGLAKVTDPRTGKNRQYVVNGTVLVPVIDYSVERLGLTTPAPPILTTASSSLRTVVRSIDLKRIDETDWLVLETALDVRERDDQCHQMGCDSMCKGDTCATGCVGGSCRAHCKGPGCLSMCIGTGCTSSCDGMSCEARCRGNGCEAKCGSFSCRFVTNGQTRYGGGAWEEHYPQYRYHRPEDNEYY